MLEPWAEISERLRRRQTPRNISFDSSLTLINARNIIPAKSTIEIAHQLADDQVGSRPEIITHGVIPDRILRTKG